MFRCFVVYFVIGLTSGCSDEPYVPKPKAYFRIDFPEKDYLRFERECPFTFEYAMRSLIDHRRRSAEEHCFFNIHYPQYNCSIHFSYLSLKENKLPDLIDDARNLAMKHLVKASGIEEKIYSNPVNNVYGIIYDFHGQTATNYQFFLTDSSEHFVRGAMYYNMLPNADSLLPVTNYVKSDLIHLIETFDWQHSLD